MLRSEPRAAAARLRGALETAPPELAGELEEQLVEALAYSDDDADEYLERLARIEEAARGTAAPTSPPPAALTSPPRASTTPAVPTTPPPASPPSHAPASPPPHAPASPAGDAVRPELLAHIAHARA